MSGHNCVVNERKQGGVMEYLRATGAWMNWINRQIDDVMVKAGISDWGRWRVS